jgi:hypothetical protein
VKLALGGCGSLQHAATQRRCLVCGRGVVGEEIVGGDDSQAALVPPSFRHRGGLIESFGFLGSINDHIGAEYRILLATWENSVVRMTWSSMQSAVKR